jgi:hypothetical protein
MNMIFRSQRLLLPALLVLASAASAQNLEFTLNGRPVSLPLDTPAIIDGEPATLATVRNLPNGMQARWSSLPMEATLGGGPTPVFSYDLIGPVTGNNPLEVLGQPITVTSDTTLANVSMPIALPLNTPVVVAGLVDVNGSVLATLVERRGAFGNTFLLTGPVRAVVPATLQLRVGAQWISYQGVAFSGCAAPLPALGEYLAVRAQAQPDYIPGTVLSNVISGSCVQLVPPGSVGASGFLQGLVTAVPGSLEFRIGSLTVTLSPTTEYVFGARDDLAPGVAVSIEGAYVATETFAATVVEFVNPVVRFEAPMTPADVTPGVSLRPFGIVVRNSAQVRDEDQILANGLTLPTQVEVRGYLDRLGRAYATRVRERGNPDPGAVQLRGPVQSIAQPQLTIQGLTVDTTGASFVDELGTPMTAGAFFAALAVGHTVDASNAVYTAGNATLSGGLITYIGAEPLQLPRSPSAGAASVNAGTASGYSNLTPLFVDGFEG